MPLDSSGIIPVSAVVPNEQIILPAKSYAAGRLLGLNGVVTRSNTVTTGQVVWTSELLTADQLILNANLRLRVAGRYTGVTGPNITHALQFLPGGVAADAQTIIAAPAVPSANGTDVGFLAEFMAKLLTRSTSGKFLGHVMHRYEFATAVMGSASTPDTGMAASPNTTIGGSFRLLVTYSSAGGGVSIGYHHLEAVFGGAHLV